MFHEAHIQIFGRIVLSIPYSDQADVVNAAGMGWVICTSFEKGFAGTCLC